MPGLLASRQILVIGYVYVGFDNPKSLGKFETGSKAALPIFVTVVKKCQFIQKTIIEFSIPSRRIFYLTLLLNYDTWFQSQILLVIKIL